MKSVACRLGACVGAILFERIRLDLDVAGSFVCQALDRIHALRLFDFRDPLVVCLRKLAGQHELSEDLVILEATKSFAIGLTSPHGLLASRQVYYTRRPYGPDIVAAGRGPIASLCVRL